MVLSAPVVSPTCVAPLPPSLTGTIPGVTGDRSTGAMPACAQTALRTIWIVWRSGVAQGLGSESHMIIGWIVSASSIGIACESLGAAARRIAIAVEIEESGRPSVGIVFALSSSKNHASERKRRV